MRWPSVPGVQRRLQSQLADDVGHDLWIDAEHLVAETLVDLAPDEIFGQRTEALKLAVLEVGVDGGWRQPTGLRRGGLRRAPA